MIAAGERMKIAFLIGPVMAIPAVAQLVRLN